MKSKAKSSGRQESRGDDGSHFVNATDPETLDRYLKAGHITVNEVSNFSFNDSEGQGTALFVSSLFNRNDNLRYLLTCLPCPDVNFKCSKDGFTALHIASVNNNFESVKILLDFDADRNIETNDKFTALELAKRGNCKEAVQLLIHYFPVMHKMSLSRLDCKLKIDELLRSNRVNQYSIDCKYVHIMITSKYPDLYNIIKSGNLTLFEEKCKSFDLTEAIINFFLSLASKENHLHVLDYLLLRAPNYNGFPSLHEAVNSGNHEIVNRLLELPDIDVDKDHDDFSFPLFLATQVGHINIIKSLLESGADIDKVDSRTSCTALHVALTSKNVEVCQFLIKEGKCNVNIKDAKGRSPLFYLIEHLEYYDQELVVFESLLKLLLDNGADVNTVDYRETTIFQMLVPYEDPKMFDHYRYTNIFEIFIMYSGLIIPDVNLLRFVNNVNLSNTIQKARVLLTFACLYNLYAYLDIISLESLAEVLLS